MKVPLEISYRGIKKSEWIESLIRSKVKKLEQFCNYISSCDIAIEKTQHFQRSGNPYRVRLDIRVPPSHEIVVKREPSKGYKNDPIDIVIRDAFDAARKQLQTLKGKQNRAVKKHPEQSVQAVVSKIFPDEGYGFIKTVDNREIYFHKNSVLHNDFEHLEVGTGVSFDEEMGNKGPQATSVKVVDKPTI